jgi:hypothetical protein
LGHIWKSKTPLPNSSSMKSVSSRRKVVVAKCEAGDEVFPITATLCGSQLNATPNQTVYAQ